jgi:hypothetical protein
MIQIAINQAAFDAIVATMSLGSVGYEAQTNAKIWLGERWINKLTALRGSGESYSEVIIRLAVTGSLMTGRPHLANKGAERAQTGRRSRPPT